MKTILVVWVTCAVADYVEGSDLINSKIYSLALTNNLLPLEREFVPSASMDTEDGWRVMQNPLGNPAEHTENDAQLYLSFPKLERLSNEIGKDFLNNDEEFRINVEDIKSADNKVDLHYGDSLPVASSLIAAAPNKIKKEIPSSPLRIVKPPKSFDDNAVRKPTLIRNNDVYVPYLPQKFIREPLMDRIPYYDMLPENTYQSLSHLDDSIYLPSYQTIPKVLPFRQILTPDSSVEYYEIDKNVRPIILKEEISYEDRPFMPHRFPVMPQKMNFPGGSMFPKPYFKSPTLPISVKARKIIRSPKRSITTFGRSSRGIPIVRGRFRV